MQGGFRARVLLVALAAGAILQSGCGSNRGSREGNQINPLRLPGCAKDLGDGVAPDQRSMAAMVVALSTAKYPIYQVSAVEFRIYTDFMEHKGILSAFEAQVFSDGSVMLTLPETMPAQRSGSMAYVQKWGRKVAGYFDRIKCAPVDQLRSKAAAAGYAF